MSPRLAEISYSPEEGLTLRFKPRSFRLLPEPTRGHLKAANKELLLALRSSIDQAIEWIDRQGPEPRRPRRRIQVKMDSGATEEERK
jgi:hypothetical protein